jgi:hypothetical protein
LTPPPGDIYRDALRPLDVVRGSLDNWSDAELAALGAGMHKARQACAETKPEQYSGDDLYDLVRLCALGQDWNAANGVALKYLASAAETHRAQAYAVSLTALVHLNDLAGAEATAHEMLQKLPFDAELAYAMRYLVGYLAQAADPEAMALAGEEHDAMVAAIATAASSGQPLRAVHGDAAIGLGALDEAAMELAFLLRYAGNEWGSKSVVAEITGAVAKAGVMSAEDRQLIDAVSTQYGLLGSPLPAISIERGLQSPTAKAKMTADFGSATVLLLFPDWCAQCRRMMKAVTGFAVGHAGANIHAYGLVFHDDAQASGLAAQTGSYAGSGTEPGNFKDLLGTPTLLVAPGTVQGFGATDFPFAVVTDGAGKVRYAGAVPANAFEANGFMEVLVGRVVADEKARDEDGDKPGKKSAPVH